MRSNKMRLASGLGASFLVLGLLSACGGGGDDPAPTPTPAPSPSPTPTPTPSLAFGTVAAGNQTSEGGEISSYAFAEHASDQTVGPLTSVAGSATTNASLASANAYAGVAIRVAAAGNLPTSSDPATRTVVDTNGYTKLSIELASSTDTHLTLKLQPRSLPSDGCVPTADVTVTGTLAAQELNLDATTFAVPSYCGSGVALSAMRDSLLAVDVSNANSTAGNHAVTVGAIKLLP